MHSALALLISPPVLMLATVGLFGWILMRPRSMVPWKLILFILANMAFGPLSTAVMNAEATSIPLKFDGHLQLIDRALGVTAFQVARVLSQPMKDWLFLAYQTLGHCMIVWYGVHLTSKQGTPKPLVYSYVAAYGLAPLFYLIVPACGPRHAFGASFPFHEPQVTAAVMPLSYWPNAIPSLHMATAVLFVYFSMPRLRMRVFAWVYLSATVGATLAFEHYVIDLIVGISYAFFVIRLAERNLRLAARNVLIVLVWLIAIRFTTPLLVLFPRILISLALLSTVWSITPSVDFPGALRSRLKSGVAQFVRL